MEKQPFDLWLEFELWGSDQGDPSDEFFNMQVTLPDGKRYALNVWTFKHLSRAVQECRASGEHLHGSYVPPPDLFVERLDRKLLESVVADLVEQNQLPDHLLIHDE